ncbi:MAG: hypothetical protein ACT4PT_11260, partial [Methanobacteriota archaeon]
ADRLRFLARLLIATIVVAPAFATGQTADCEAVRAGHAKETSALSARHEDERRRLAAHQAEAHRNTTDPETARHVEAERHELAARQMREEAALHDAWRPRVAAACGDGTNSTAGAPAREPATGQAPPPAEPGPGAAGTSAPPPASQCEAARTEYQRATAAVAERFRHEFATLQAHQKEEAARAPPENGTWDAHWHEEQAAVKARYHSESEDVRVRHEARVHAACSAGDAHPAAPQPMTEDCRALAESLRAEMEALRSGKEEERRALHARHQKEAADLAARGASDEDARTLAARHQNEVSAFEAAARTLADGKAREAAARFHARCSAGASGPGAPAAGHAAEPSAPNPACRGYFEARHRERVEIGDRQGRERFELEARHRSDARAFETPPPATDPNGTDPATAARRDEERHAVGARHEAERRALEARHKEEWRAYEERSAATPPPPECHGGRPEAPEFAGPHGKACGFEASGGAERAVVLRAEEDGRRFFDELEAKHRRFHEAQSGAVDESAHGRLHTDLDRMKDEFQAGNSKRVQAMYAHAAVDCPYAGGARPDAAMRASTEPGHVEKDHEIRALRERAELETFQKTQGCRDRREAAMRDFHATNRTDAERADFERVHEEKLKACFGEAHRDLARGEAEHKARWEAAHRNESRAKHDLVGSFAAEEDAETGRVRMVGKYVSFAGEPATGTVLDLQVGGALFFTRVYSTEIFSEGGVEAGGAAPVLRLGDAAGRTTILLHDGPRGVVNVRASGGASVVFDVADPVDVVAEPRSLALTSGGRTARVTTDGCDIAYDAGPKVATLSCNGLFLVKGRDEALADVGNRHRDEIDRAIEARKVAAEVTVVKAQRDGKDGNGGADGDGGTVDEPLAYGDVTVTVAPPRKDEKKVSVLVESEKHEGKTIVVNVDHEILGTDRVRVAYYSQGAAGETEEEIHEAGSLEDVLDASDDGTRAEYWVVTDRDGVKVLASIPGFSAKRLEVAAAGGLDPVRVPFPATGFIIVALAIAILIRRR